jgi:hypothetical protein
MLLLYHAPDAVGDQLEAIRHVLADFFDHAVRCRDNQLLGSFRVVPDDAACEARTMTRRRPVIPR